MLLFQSKINEAFSMIAEFETTILLNGDYCLISMSDWEKQSKELMDFLQQNLQNLGQDNFGNEATEYFLTNLLNPLEADILPSISYLLQDLDRQFGYKPLGMHHKWLTTDIRNKVYSFEGYWALKVFVNALRVVALEHFRFEYSEKTFRDLSRWKREVDKINTFQTLIKAIQVKINFLLRKLVYRSQCDKGRVNWSYSYNNTDEITFTLQTIDKEPLLDRWEKVIEVHYGLVDDYKILQRERIQEMILKSAQFHFEKSHARAKIYKDDIGSQHNLSLLQVDFTSAANQYTVPFDNYAFKISSNYLFNNELSFNVHVALEEGNELSTDTLKDTNREFLKKIDSLIADTKNFQNQTFVKNFFPWMKLCEALSEKMEDVSKKLVEVANFELYEKLKKRLDEVVSKFEQSFEWSNVRKLMPFQLPFDESQSDYQFATSNFGTFNLFFFSGYLVPLNYSQMAARKENIKNKVTKFDILSSVYDRLKKVVETVQETSETVKNAERRSIEVIAIFSAISLFTVGSIQMLANVQIGSDPMFFFKMVSSYGFCLLMFAILIWIISRPNLGSIKWFHWLVLGILLLISATVIFTFVFTDLGQVKIINHP
ncbi:MAG: hypothetical protein J7577_12095 [Sphingobacteriaceae bacterium]|nr:hypothetical protein [Sphingobacteriaceae bacterium]